MFSSNTLASINRFIESFYCKIYYLKLPCNRNIGFRNGGSKAKKCGK